MSRRTEAEARISQSELRDYEDDCYEELKRGSLKIHVSDSVYRCPYCSRERKKDYRFFELLRHAAGIANGKYSRSPRDEARHAALERYMERRNRSEQTISDKNRSSRPPIPSRKRYSKSPIPAKDKGSDPYNAVRNLGKRIPEPPVLAKNRSSELSDPAIKRREKSPEPVIASRKESLVEPPIPERSLNSSPSARERGLVEPPIPVTERSLNSSTSARERVSDSPTPPRNRISEPPMRINYGRAHNQDDKQLFVHPWMGIVANIPTKVEGGRTVGESGNKLKEELTSQGFNPKKVHPLWSRKGHSGFAVVEFDKEWSGFKNAIMFDKSFKSKHSGKEDYYAARNQGDILYGWIASDDDYYSNSLIGNHLHKHGDLKTVSGKEAEDERKASMLVSSLKHTLKTKKMHLKEMQSKYVETSVTVNKLMEENQEMIRCYDEEKKRMRQASHDHSKKISLAHEKMTMDLKNQQRDLDQREKELMQRAVHNETERRELKLKKEMNERAALEQKKANETLVKLAEEQKKETEELHKKILELEKNVDKEHALQLEIERLRGALQVVKHMGEDDDDTETKEKLTAMQEDLEEKEEELETLEALNQALIIKEQKCNDELEEARKELINSLKDVKARTKIGVKTMGEIDKKPFLTATKRKLSANEADNEATQLHSLWSDYLMDPNWHPFKEINDKEGNKTEIIDEDDERLKDLKNELGDEVHDAVVTALKELNECDLTGGNTGLELWNFGELRKATLEEGMEYMLERWKQSKRKK